jgi:hypothetical protein
MQFIILSLFVAAGSFDYLQAEGWFPPQAAYLQEVLAIIIAGTIVIAAARNGLQNVHATYWVVFAGLLLVILCGIVINVVGSGPVFAGLRTYLRAIPLFFLPAVLMMRERQIRTQLLFVLLIAMVQLPISLDQRMTTFASAYLSGDRTVGTLMGSGLLTIFCVCVACVLTGFYMRKRMRGWVYFILLSLTLAPTMLNETKVVIVLVPLGLLITFIVASKPQHRLRNGLVATFLLGLFAVVFVPVYDHFMKPRWGYGIVDFFTMEGRVEGYLDKNASMGARKAGRVDALVVPLEQLAKDPTTLAFGYGIGNVSDSALGEEFTGEYYRRYEPFLMSSATVLMLETGLFGLGCVLLLFLFIWRDARLVARSDDGMLGALAVGWMGVTGVMVVSLFYNTIIDNGTLSFLFWYFSGLIAAQRMRLGYAAQERTLQVARTQKAWKRVHATG